MENFGWTISICPPDRSGHFGDLEYIRINTVCKVNLLLLHLHLWQFEHSILFSYLVSPTLTLYPSVERDVVSGEDLIVECRGSADPLPVIQWFRGDQQLIDGDQSSITSQSIDDITTSSRLTVTGFTSDEAGVYSCVAVNALGSDFRSFQVNTVGESVKSILLVISHNSYVHT